MKTIRAAVALAAIVAAPAAAAPATYTLSGTVNGFLSDVPFSTDVVFTGIGDTATIVDNGMVSTIVLSSLVAVAGGITYTLTDPSVFFTNTNGISGFSLIDGQDFLDFSAPALAGSTASDSLGATPVTFEFGDYFNTDLGQAIVTSASGLSFAASVTAVPEPATWGLMIAGFAMTGLSSRRRVRLAA